MMYSEFVAGTGCKDNEHNYKIYKDLEIMYMNSDISKQEVYEYGKKLVDNSKSEEQLKLEAEIKAEIKELKEQLKDATEKARRYEEWHKEEKKATGVKETFWKSEAEWQRDLARKTRNKIAELKWVLN
jgi:hypothetical protein